MARYGHITSDGSRQLVQLPTPFFLAAQRRTALAVKKKLPKENPWEGFSLDSFGSKRAAALLRSRGVEVSTTCPMGQSSTGFGSTLFLACKHFLVCKMTNDFPAEQQIWKTCPPQGIFALQKSLRVGCDGGTGVLIAEQAVPAQRNFQRKFALRRVGSYKFVVPPTIEYSKVRSTLNWYNHPYRAARGARGAAAPLFRKESRGNPFEGFPLGNFFAEARHGASLRS